MEKNKKKTIGWGTEMDISQFFFIYYEPLLLIRTDNYDPNQEHIVNPN